ncbi:unnamed protein product [Brachionus calyciflorus]|uniref:CCHC-type domain-containing protein n=1 Tax=Brachionus calyciflorus TaxID=104777 RepID=A0A813MRR3_9BILA|nr:unnamed protein product [Brachionus calyciflorus]
MAKIEVTVTKEILEGLKLEELNMILRGLIEKISREKPMYLLADNTSPNKLIQVSKEEFEKFIKEAVEDKIKINDLTPKDRMVTLIMRLSGYNDQIREDQMKTLAKENDKLSQQVDVLAAEFEKARREVKVRNETITVNESTENKIGSNQIMLKNDWVTSIPIFKASEKEVLDEWIYIIEKLAKKNNVKLDDLVDEVAPFLKERALRSYRLWEKDSPDRSWESLKKKFYGLYNSRDSQNKLREKLLGMKINKSNFEDKVKQFESTVSRIVNITEDDKIFMFIHTLAENVRQMVTAMKPNSLREAIEHGQIYTSSLGEIEKVNYLKTRNYDFKRNNRDYINRNSYNKQNKRPEKSYNNNNNNNNNYNNNNYKNNRTMQLKCYNCDKIGHVKANCRVRKRLHKVKIIEDLDDNDRMETVKTIATRNI